MLWEPAFYFDDAYNKPFIVFHAGLYSRLSQAQKDFIIGHEVGHILYSGIDYAVEKRSVSLGRGIELKNEIENRADIFGVLVTKKINPGMDVEKLVKELADLFEKRFEEVRLQVKLKATEEGEEDALFDVHSSDNYRVKNFAEVLKSAQRNESEVFNMIFGNWGIDVDPYYNSGEPATKVVDRVMRVQQPIRTLDGRGLISHAMISSSHEIQHPLLNVTITAQNEQQRSLLKDVIEEIVHYVPPSHVSALKEIRVTNAFKGRLIGGAAEAVVYKGIIFISPGYFNDRENDREELKHALLHEIGHFYEKIIDRDIYQWKKLSDWKYSLIRELFRDAIMVGTMLIVYPSTKSFDFLLKETILISLGISAWYLSSTLFDSLIIFKKNEWFPYIDLEKTGPPPYASKNWKEDFAESYAAYIDPNKRPAFQAETSRNKFLGLKYEFFNTREDISSWQQSIKVDDTMKSGGITNKWISWEAGNPSNRARDRAMISEKKNNVTMAGMSRRNFFLLGTAAGVVTATEFSRLSLAQELLLAPVTGLPEGSGAQRIIKKKSSPGVLKIRALNGDNDALKEIIRRAEKELPFAKTLKDLYAYRLPDARDAIKNNSFDYYLKQAEKGDFDALDFLESIFYDNHQIRDEIRSMDIQVFVRRSELSPEEGQEKGWEKGRNRYVNELFMLADYYHNLEAMAALRNIDPTGLKDNVKHLAEIGNFAAIDQLAETYSNHVAGPVEPLDATLLEGSLDEEKIQQIYTALDYKQIGAEDEKLLREYDFKDLIKMALGGNENAVGLVNLLISQIGHKAVAEEWASIDLKDMEEGLKKGDYKTFQLLMALYKFGNQNAINELPYVDISGLVQQAENGDVKAVNTLIDLTYYHLQAVNALHGLKIDQFTKPFLVEGSQQESKEAKEQSKGTMEGASVLLKLGRDFDNQMALSVIAGDKLDFTKAANWGYAPSEAPLDSFFDIADMGNTLMINYLRREIDVRKIFSASLPNLPSYPHLLRGMSKILYILAMSYSNPSALMLLFSLDPQFLSKGIEEGESGFAELFYAQQKIRADKLKVVPDLKTLEQKVREGEKAQEKKKQQEKEQEEQEQNRQDQQNIKNDGSKPDNAMKGGIDLTPANMHLQTQNAGEGIKFYLDPAMLQQLQNAPGFVPVIISIQPLKSLPEFLGLNQSQTSASLVSSS